MPHLTFTSPDLTTFCRLDELGLIVTGQSGSDLTVQCLPAGWWNQINGVTAAVVKECPGTR